MASRAPPSVVRRLLRSMATALALLLLLLGVALLAGSLVPQNRGARQPEPGAPAIVIHVDASPVHSWLILPVIAAGHDWRGRLPLPPEALHVALSWGERDFFLATPRWADLDPVVALRALAGGSGAVVHVVPVAGAPPGRAIRLSPSAYRRLVVHLEAQLAEGAALPGYGGGDWFVPATGRYAPWRTCNQWTRDALAAAGVRVGLWTPLPQGLMWRFDQGRAG